MRQFALQKGVGIQKIPTLALRNYSMTLSNCNKFQYSQYESDGTFFVGFIMEYLEKLSAIILIIYSSRPFNEERNEEFALRGSN